MKRFFLFVCVIACLAVSCTSQRYTPYFDDAQRDVAERTLSQQAFLIMPGDLLRITVENRNDAEMSIEFNRLKAGDRVNTGIVGTPYDYSVDDEGKISFPVLGRVLVAGITYDSLSRKLSEMLIESGMLVAPVVRVELRNFRVAVLGEVKRPMFVHAEGWRLTVFEALAMVGDITMDGDRTKVSVVRYDSDSMRVATLDLSSREVLDSPYYYLRPHDVVYVEPTKLKKRMAVRDINIPRYISVGVSLASIIRRTYQGIWKTSR